MANKNDYDWNATAYFKELVRRNRMAQDYGFCFCRVSGLDGFEEALSAMQDAKAFVCVDELGAGYSQLSPSPRTRRVKTVFLAMRHAIDDMEARQRCLDVMRELFRQLMSALIREKTAIEEHFLYVDPKIQFSEISSYFASGCACASFQIAVDSMTNLCYDEDEWI